MNSDLEHRRAYLLARCARQREQLCSEISHIEQQLGGVERGIRIAKQLMTLPGLLVSGSILAMVLIKGRGRTLQLISTGLALWAAIRRLRQGRVQISELLPLAD